MRVLNNRKTSKLHTAENYSGTLEYCHQDHLGSTRLKTGGTGGVVYESNYES